MSYTPSTTTPSQDERIMAALAHVSILLPFMGLIAPILIWVTHKEKSAFVAFQALQATAFQLSLILSWFVGMGCYMCSFFGMFLSIPLMSTTPESASPFMVLPFLLPFCVFGSLFVVGGAMIIYGFVAAILTLQGKDFRYLVIGDRVSRFMQSDQK